MLVASVEDAWTADCNCSVSSLRNFHSGLISCQLHLKPQKHPCLIRKVTSSSSLEMQVFFCAKYVRLGVVLLRKVIRGTSHNNTVTVKYINHVGGTMSAGCLCLAQRLLRLTYPPLVSLRVTHQPGRHNDSTDTLSTQPICLGEWHLYPEVVSKIWDRSDKTQTDPIPDVTSTFCRLTAAETGAYR